MKVIVGLGNPGEAYKKTRHNVGFNAVERIGRAFSFHDAGIKTKIKARIAEGNIAGTKAILVKPETFMNLSGEAVQAVLHYYKMSVEDLIVIYDDFAIAPGMLRIRQDGSAGGHNGIKSIIQHVGTDQFVRVRIGIAPFNAFQGAHSNYVLGKLAPQEIEVLDGSLKKIPEVVEVIITEGVEKAMNRFN